MSLDLKTLPHLTIAQKRDFPKITGLYFVVSENELLYVGLTTDLQKRWKNHHLLNQFPPQAELYWLEAEEAVLLAKEKEYIAELNPLLNGNHGGAGRRKGARNRVQKAPGFRISTWLKPHFAQEFERLRGGQAVGAFVCELLKLHPDYQPPALESSETP